MTAGSDAESHTAHWSEHWLAEIGAKRASLWRGVEAQHRIATLKVVDTSAEQDLLEALLEQSKPPLPAQADAAHYLLATPFRYLSGWPSRFRAPADPGVWYGAERLETACAEVAYWRWRFAGDSEGLRTQAVLTEHTFFEARVAGRVVDLTRAPWSRLATRWMDPAHYGECQSLASAARRAAADWIRYRSVRDPRHRPCAAVLSLASLSLAPLTRQQTWACKVAGAIALMRPLAIASSAQPLEFRFE